MAKLEVGKFKISIGLDTATAGNWTEVSRTSAFSLAELDLLLRLLGEGWISCSVLDTQPQPVIGLLRDGRRQTLFAMATAAEASHFDLDVMVDPRRGGYDRHLLTCWQTWTMDPSRVMIMGNQPVDSEAFIERFGRKPASKRFSKGIPEAGARQHIAILQADPRQRLALVQLAAAQVERRNGLPCVIVDNATVVFGTTANVVGLAPSHRRSASNWLIVSSDPPAGLTQDLELMKRFVARVRPLNAGASATIAADAASRGRRVVVASLIVVIERAAMIVEAALAQAPLAPGSVELRTLFETVGAIGAESPANDSEGLLARALLLRRMPSVLAGVADMLPGYAEDVAQAAFGTHAAVVAQAAQACFDWVRSQGATADPQVIGALERLLSTLAARVSRALCGASEHAESIAPCPDRQLWEVEDEVAILDAFDTIGEIESLSLALDREMMATVDRVRLACGRLTALGLCRTWPDYLRMRPDQAFGRGMGAPHIDPRVVSIAMLVAIDTLAVDTVRASSLVAGLLGVEEIVTTRRSGMTALDVVIARNARRRSAPSSVA